MTVSIVGQHLTCTVPPADCNSVSVICMVSFLQEPVCYCGVAIVIRNGLPQLPFESQHSRDMRRQSAGVDDGAGIVKGGTRQVYYVASGGK